MDPNTHQVDEDGIKTGRWTEAEHEIFVKAFNEITGSKKWKRISEMIQTRSSDQVRSHAQKYLLKLKKGTGSENPETENPEIEKPPVDSTQELFSKKKELEKRLAEGLPLNQKDIEAIIAKAFEAGQQYVPSPHVVPFMFPSSGNQLFHPGPFPRQPVPPTNCFAPPNIPTPQMPGGFVVDYPPHYCYPPGNYYYPQAQTGPFSVPQHGGAPVSGFPPGFLSVGRVGPTNPFDNVEGLTTSIPTKKEERKTVEEEEPITAKKEEDPKQTLDLECQEEDEDEEKVGPVDEEDNKVLGEKEGKDTESTKINKKQKVC